jgi:sporulation protein YlmC with PRC-barrel domain
MKRNIYLSAAFLCATTLVAGAQTGQPNRPGDTTPPARANDAMSMDDRLSVHTCDDLIGADVKNPQGENLGKIEDLVLHSDGNVAYAVLSYGGVLGMGDKLFAVPWCLVKTAPDDAGRDDERDAGGDRTVRAAGYDDDYHVVLSIEKERLKGAPGFDKDTWPTQANVAMFGDCERYYGPELSSVKRPMEASAPAAGSFIVRASELKGENVETPSGDKLGDIKEVVIDPSHARVNYVVLSVGGFLGVGDRLVAVPWSALKSMRDGDDTKVTLATTKEKLEKAPEFHAGEARWAEMSDPVWIGRVYTYYSVRPYWSEGASDQPRYDDKPKTDKGKDPLKKD